MPTAASLRRVGFPTALGVILVALLWASPARAALAPPPFRLAEIFAREVWGDPHTPPPIPLLRMSVPFPYEVP